MYIVYIREGHCLSLACTIKKFITKFEIKVDVHKGPGSVTNFFDDIMLVSFNLDVFIHYCHMVIVPSDYLVHSCRVSYMSLRFIYFLIYICVFSGGIHQIKLKILL